MLSLYPDAAEAGGCFRASKRAKATSGADPERAAAEAARRARAEIRRYAAANRLNRLGTLTYAGAGRHDPRELREDVATFFRAVRPGIGAASMVNRSESADESFRLRPWCLRRSRTPLRPARTQPFPPRQKGGPSANEAASARPAPGACLGTRGQAQLVAVPRAASRAARPQAAPATLRRLARIPGCRPGRNTSRGRALGSGLSWPSSRAAIAAARMLRARLRAMLRYRVTGSIPDFGLF